MPFQLKRPIVFFDIESTGLDTQIDRIVEISIYKVYPGGIEIDSKTRRINPEMHISEGATEVHGIKDEDIKDMPTFTKVAKSLYDLIQDSDIAGFNSNRFDCPMLYNEFRRAGIEWDYHQHHLIDIGNLFKIKEPRTLEAAVKFYLDRDHDGAHGAEADVMATAEVFFEQIQKYNDLPHEMDELSLLTNYDKPILDLSGKFSTDADGDIILCFGKYRNEKAKDHLDFVDWMYSKADFPSDTRSICEQLLNQYYKQDANTN